MNLKLSHKCYASLKGDLTALVTNVELLEQILDTIKIRCEYDETANTYSREVYERRKQKLKEEGKSMYSNYQREYYAKNKEVLNKKRVEAWRVAKETNRENESLKDVDVNDEMQMAPKKRGPRPKVSEKKHKVCHCGKGCRVVNNGTGSGDETVECN